MGISLTIRANGCPQEGIHIVVHIQAVRATLIPKDKATPIETSARGTLTIEVVRDKRNILAVTREKWYSQETEAGGPRPVLRSLYTCLGKLLSYGIF